MQIENLFTRAKNWLTTQNPNLKEIADAYKGMQKRIENGKVVVVDDAEAALDLMAEAYDNLGGDVSLLLDELTTPLTPSNTSGATVEPISTAQLDISPLVPFDAVTQKALSDEERKAILADLKLTLRTTAGKFANANP